jgi:hypothetical protein
MDKSPRTVIKNAVIAGDQKAEDIRYQISDIEGHIGDVSGCYRDHPWDDRMADHLFVKLEKGASWTKAKRYGYLSERDIYQSLPDIEKCIKLGKEKKTCIR